MNEKLPIVRHLPYLAPCGLGVMWKRLSYRDWQGPPTRPPVICLHGLNGNAKADFDALAASLSKTRRVIALDFPGRGDSDWLCNPEDYSFVLYATLVGVLVWHLEHGRRSGDAEELCQRVFSSFFDWMSGNPTPLEARNRMATLVGELGCVQQFDFVLTSMGGIIGMMYASLPGAPVRRLVINDVGPTIPGSALTRISRAISEKPPIFNDMREAEAYQRRIHGGFVLNDQQWATLTRNSVRARPEDGKLEVNYDTRIAAAFKRGGFSPFPGHQTPDDRSLWPFFLACKAPKLLLRGETSDVLTAEIAQEMLARGRNIRMVECRGGHVPQLVDPGEIKAIEDFLNER